jgi:alkyl hydroperoxide reductase subunit AhpC
MYQPVMREGVIRSIYRMKRALGKPMTRILDEIVANGFSAAEKERVCPLCREEGNDDCSNCYLNRRR